MYAILLFLVLSFWAPLAVQSLANFTGVITIQGACKDFCNLNRLNGYGHPHHLQGPYHFDCDDKDENCLKACVICPAPVCDEYARKTLYDDFHRYEFHCPPFVLPESGKCYKRCDLNRYKGSRKSYSFSCEDDISPDKNGCHTCDDYDCAEIVCKPNDNIYHCPYELSGNVCEDRCDRSRDYKNVIPYELDCSSQSDKPICELERNDCPNYMTNGPGSKYSCPSPQMIGFDECRELCNKHRNFYVSAEYVLNCSEHYSNSTCASLCSSKCPSYVCNPKSGDHLFYCPREEDKSLAYFISKKRYKGKCKERCDKSRGGGIFAYKLDCSKYYSEQEKTLCLHNCYDDCPEEVCQNTTILCKEVQQEVDKLKKEKKEFEGQLVYEYTNLRRTLFVQHKHIMITLAVLLAIVILATIIFVCWACWKKRVAPEVVNGRTMSMQETHSVRTLSSSQTSASTSTLQQQPVRKSLPPTHPK